jgi:hypothetical protein
MNARLHLAYDTTLPELDRLQLAPHLTRLVTSIVAVAEAKARSQVVAPTLDPPRLDYDASGNA